MQLLLGILIGWGGGLLFRTSWENLLITWLLGYGTDR